MIPAEAVEAPICVSSIHAQPVRATIRGTWLEFLTLARIPDVWYCEPCALTAESYRLFTRDGTP